jgi:hypothetical protein
LEKNFRCNSSFASCLFETIFEQINQESTYQEHELTIPSNCKEESFIQCFTQLFRLLSDDPFVIKNTQFEVFLSLLESIECQILRFAICQVKEIPTNSEESLVLLQLAKQISTSIQYQESVKIVAENFSTVGVQLLNTLTVSVLS